tara:strand:- start:239 stop:1771 length:1533 start_codon:yes stop_codon:yes gene_type:complete
MLGRVLSGSKHGVRQTRGKFGLGAKMALIWSKKSSGLPIKIKTAHSTTPGIFPDLITTVVLDIDIHKNEPRILKKTTERNDQNWRGCEISVTISGNWSAYRSRVLMYFQQLAVITPYAHLSLDYRKSKDNKNDFTAEFLHRSQQMPPLTKEVPPHPKSLNHITLSSMLTESRHKHLSKFLTNDLSGISAPVASKLVAAIGETHTNMSSAKVTALCQSLRDEKSIKPPPFNCLSPAGEYNLRLGILKELQPKLIATFTDKPGAHEGHPFIVEAAISIGGSGVGSGLKVYRYANRIPLLFETGADVVTRVATTKINWSSYHIDMNRDAVGVYVSIVATKIPFKGTSKEYIGEDVTEIHKSVVRCLQGCCQQLRVSLAQNKARKEEQERKKTLEKYIPDVSKSLITVLEKMTEKRKIGTIALTHKNPTSMSKILDAVDGDMISAESLKKNLQAGVDKLEQETVLQAAASDASANSAKRQKFVLADCMDLNAMVDDLAIGDWLALKGLDAKILL